MWMDKLTMINHRGENSMLNVILTTVAVAVVEKIVEEIFDEDD